MTENPTGAPPSAVDERGSDPSTASPSTAATRASAMCGRPGVAPGGTFASTAAYVTGMPSAANRATMRSSRVTRESRALASSAASGSYAGSTR